MKISFTKPIVEIVNENPDFESGKSLTWIKVSVSGFGLIQISCPLITTWKTKTFLVNKPARFLITAPINSTLAIKSWYLCGLDKSIYKVNDSKWIVKSPAVSLQNEKIKNEVLKSHESFTKNLLKKQIFSISKKSFIYTKHEINFSLIRAKFDNKKIIPMIELLNSKNYFLFKFKKINLRAFYKKEAENE